MITESLSNAKQLAKNNIKSIRKAFVGPFKHHRAQKYELKSATQTMKIHFHELFEKFEHAKKTNSPYFDSNNQFFQNDDKLWNQFLDYTRGKKALEIGSGPFGFLAFTTWASERHVVDPLLDSYKNVQKELFGKTIFSNEIKGYSTPAEELIKDLVGKIDGFIVCRNCIDHTEDPWSILYNITQYAAPGSYLLFWADIWHIGGSIDEGHHSVTKNHKVIEAFLEGQGYQILKTHDGISTHGNTIDYGCVAIKSNM